MNAALLLGASAIYDRAALARRYAMPLLLEEVGYRPPDSIAGRERDGERADALCGLLAVAEDQGVATLPG